MTAKNGEHKISVEQHHSWGDQDREERLDDGARKQPSSAAERRTSLVIHQTQQNPQYFRQEKNDHGNDEERDNLVTLHNRPNQERADSRNQKNRAGAVRDRAHPLY